MDMASRGSSSGRVRAGDAISALTAATSIHAGIGPECMARVSEETTAANAHDEAETLVDAIARVARDIEEIRREAGRMHVTAEILDDDGLDQWRIPRSDEVHIIGDADDDIAARRRAPRRPAAEDMMMSELGSGVL